MQDRVKRQFIYLGAAILWGSFIFYLSSIPGLSSGLESRYDFVLRKLAHIFVFGVLSYLIASSLDTHRRGLVFFVLLASIFYAFLDEVHQTTVLTRSGNARDILFDAVGVYLGIWFWRDKIPQIVLQKIYFKFK